MNHERLVVVSVVSGSMAFCLIWGTIMKDFKGYQMIEGIFLFLPLTILRA
jgi:hypothetical protein